MLSKASIGLNPVFSLTQRKKRKKRSNARFHATYAAYHVTNSSHVIGHFLSCLRQIRTCSVSLARRVLDLALFGLLALRA